MQVSTLTDELQMTAATIQELESKNDTLTKTCDQIKNLKALMENGSSEDLVKREQGLERRRSFQRTKRADNQHKAKVSMAVSR